MPLEKEIVKYIHDLPGDDKFFIKFDTEKAAFLNEFSRYGIKDYSEEALKEEKISKFKNWSKSTPKFKQYVNYFAKNNSHIIEPFLTKFLDELNKKLEARSLPKIIR